jgi:hypothetical protein
MEMLQENSMCHYLKQAKMSFFYFTKSEEGGTGVEVGTSGRGKKVGKDVGV